MKRILLFVATNFAIMIALSIVLSVLGFTGYVRCNGLDYAGLLVFSLVWGFGGALISLAMSRWMAKSAMGEHFPSASSANSLSSRSTARA